jgi:hypothetical protein
MSQLTIERVIKSRCDEFHPCREFSVRCYDLNDTKKTALLSTPFALLDDALTLAEPKSLMIDKYSRIVIEQRRNQTLDSH